MNRIKADMIQATSSEAELIRAPLITDPDGSTHGEYEKCSYAFFPGCQLSAFEPEIVAKVYDALLFQNPDTAMFMYCCGKPVELDADVASPIDYIRTKWEELGKPKMIMACPTCMKVFSEQLPEIPLLSLYDLLLEYGISGGCNSVDYTIVHHPAADDSMKEDVKALAEDMGVRLHEEDNADENLPAITYSIVLRNRLKNEGKDSAHILELMFGMGDSNAHLIHEHDHGNDGDHDDNCSHKDQVEECDGNCSSCSLCESLPRISLPLPSQEKRWENRVELRSVLLALYWNEM
ncbi:MAG: heterodisulfide reductase-related iron-sulfur binding cluster [Bacillota bacterium]|nr:heterodisulfide reductase-related iron-sulfur binding cluster [Bacillota bacterium]